MPAACSAPVDRGMSSLSSEREKKRRRRMASVDCSVIGVSVRRASRSAALKRHWPYSSSISVCQILVQAILTRLRGGARERARVSRRARALSLRCGE